MTKLIDKGHFFFAEAVIEIMHETIDGDNSTSLSDPLRELGHR